MDPKAQTNVFRAVEAGDLTAVTDFCAALAPAVEAYFETRGLGPEAARAAQHVIGELVCALPGVTLNAGAFRSLVFELARDHEVEQALLCDDFSVTVPIEVIGVGHELKLSFDRGWLAALQAKLGNPQPARRPPLQLASVEGEHAAAHPGWHASLPRALRDAVRCYSRDDEDCVEELTYLASLRSP